MSATEPKAVSVPCDDRPAGGIWLIVDREGNFRWLEYEPDQGDLAEDETAIQLTRQGIAQLLRIIGDIVQETTIMSSPINEPDPDVKTGTKYRVKAYDFGSDEPVATWIWHSDEEFRAHAKDMDVLSSGFYEVHAWKGGKDLGLLDGMSASPVEDALSSQVEALIKQANELASDN
jgi:hypothetical protein